MSANIPDPQAVLEQLEEIKRKYLAAQTDVSAVRATGFDQDRHVSVTVLGLGEVSDVKIAPAAVDPADVDGLQRKILQAFRSANDQARDLAAQILSPLNIALPEPEATAQGLASAGSEPPEDAPDSPSLSAPSSEAVPSLSPGVSLSPALSSLASGLSAASADVSLTEFPGASPEEPEAAASGPAAPEPAPQRPSLANYQHYRPRW